jgi:hypothetical protein
MHEFTREFPYTWFGDDKGSADAPREVVRPLVSLLATEALLFGHGRRESTDTSSSWTLTAVTETRLLRVEATATGSDWDAASEPQPDAEIKATAYRLRDIKTVQVAGVVLYRSGFDANDPSWRPQYEATFQDGTTLTLPPLDAQHDSDRERAESLNRHVLEATYGAS